MLNEQDLIIPDWPAPLSVKAIQTTRHGGVSHAPYDSLNLGMHVADDPMSVTANRQRLSPFLPSEPVWLNQVHGVEVIDAVAAGCAVPDADASYAVAKGVVCVVMTADCLPVLLCNESGTVVAAIHAGWRSLLDGVIEQTVNVIRQRSSDPLMAWFGPGIGPQAFEVGDEVKAAFVAKHALASHAFVATENGKWLGDIYALARIRLNDVGVTAIYGGGLCTYTDAERFYSFRRDGTTGRMATLIWLSGD